MSSVYYFLNSAYNEKNLQHHSSHKHKNNVYINTPILIISYNNYKYVRQMILQIEGLLDNPNIIVIDNHSTCPYTRRYLSTIRHHKVIHRKQNDGHNVWMSPDIFDRLPPKFILTDPDLKFNEKMPSTFIQTLIYVSDKYKSKKVGLALDISDPEKMFPYDFSMCGYPNITTIWGSQKQYWQHRIHEEKKYELYYADVDTTFCLYNKEYNGKDIRIAGDYTVKHLPWYIHNQDVSRWQRYMMYAGASASSSIRCFELQYLKDKKIKPIKKNNETILVQLDGGRNDEFWLKIYPTWEKDTFQILDKYLRPDKQFLDVGSWVGPTCLYAMRKSSHVVCVEADPISAKKLRHHIGLNGCDVRVDVVERAVYSKHKKNIVFGPNKNLSNSQLNDSTSQVKTEKTRDEDTLVKTITLDEIIVGYNLNNMSLIKIDIEGGEENIMEDINKYIGKVPVYLSFHYSWWNNKNLDRFHFLKENHKREIRSNPFTSILFI